MQCPCLIADDSGNCVDCGKPLVNPEFTEALFRQYGIELKELPYDYTPTLPSNLGNIIAIGELAQDTIAEYDRRAWANEDPQRPSVPRLQLIGGRLMRISFHDIWREVIGRSYEKACLLGYRGTLARWQEIVRDSRLEDSTN